MVSYPSINLPAVRDVRADIEIPIAVWDSWIPAAGPRQIRRPLTEEERGVVERRRDELAPAVAPYHQERDLDQVALAVTDMFGGYTSMRQSDDEAVAKLDSVRRVLAPFPAWAIEKACNAIQTNGVWRDGKFDRQWPPNDSEIVAAVREHLRLYGDQHQNAVALLSAEVKK